MYVAALGSIIEYCDDYVVLVLIIIVLLLVYVCLGFNLLIGIELLMHGPYILTFWNPHFCAGYNHLKYQKG